MATLPDTMPAGCNYYGLLTTADQPETVAAVFSAAGWQVQISSTGFRLVYDWAELALENGCPMIVSGLIERPDQHLGELHTILQRLGEMVAQWLDGNGELWREMPFDPSMLEPDDPRLPPRIREEVRASFLQGETKAIPKPWWRFW